MAFSIVSSDLGSTITVFEDGKVQIADSSHPNYAAIVAGAIAGEKVGELFDVAAAISARFERLSDRVTLRGSSLYFDGDIVEDTLAEHVLAFMNDGLDFAPLVKFWERLAANPSDHSRTQLYRWLAKNKIQIDSDGFLVMYKGVSVDGNEIYHSINSGPAIVNGVAVNGHVPQSIGDIVEMARSSVMFDPAVGCSSGLHAASFDYAKGFARGAILTLKVDPSAVVSVPTDCNDAKVRCCRYVVTGVTEVELPDLLISYAWDEDLYDDEDWEDDGWDETLNDGLEEDETPYHNVRDCKGRFCKS